MTCILLVIVLQNTNIADLPWLNPFIPIVQQPCYIELVQLCIVLIMKSNHDKVI